MNLPCPVELHKTYDHASYFKSADVAQRLIVYENEDSFQEALQEEKPISGFPSYHPSGLTPPMERVVERRFAPCLTNLRGRNGATAPPKAAVQEMEPFILQVMEQLHEASGRKRRSQKEIVTLTKAEHDLVEVEEEVVEFEPWMIGHGKQPEGIEFKEDAEIAKLHPEIWLSP